MITALVIAYLLVGGLLAFGWISTELSAEPRRGLVLAFVALAIGWPLLLLGITAIALAAGKIDPYRPKGAA